MGLLNFLLGSDNTEDDEYNSPATEAQLASAARKGKPGCHPASYREFAKNARKDGRSISDVEDCYEMWDAE